MTAARTLMVENYDVIRFPLKSIFVFVCCLSNISLVKHTLYIFWMKFSSYHLILLLYCIFLYLLDHAQASSLLLSMLYHNK